MATLVETPDAVLEGLRASPDYTKIDFAGEEREVNFCIYAFDKAKGMGHDPVKPEGNFADLLFAAMLPFPTAMTHEEVTVWLSVKRMRELRSELGDLLPKFMMTEEAREKAREETSGKGKGEEAP